MHLLQHAKNASSDSLFLAVLGFMNDCSRVFSDSEQVVVEASGFRMQLASEEANSKHRLSVLELLAKSKAEAELWV